MGHTLHHQGLALDEEMIAREDEEDRARRETDDESPPGSLL
jgi:hypothetical protein